MFSGVYSSEATQFNVVFTVSAALTVILSAVYMLNMIQKVFWGNTSALTEKAKEIAKHEQLILAVIVVAILLLGVFPRPILDLTSGTVDAILSKMNYKY
jgi:NADH-quinone oxidoreductase subunit M